MANDLDKRHKGANIAIIILAVISIFISILASYITALNKHIIAYRIIDAIWYIAFFLSMFIIIIMIIYNSQPVISITDQNESYAKEEYSPCPPIWLDNSIKEEYSPCPPIWLDNSIKEEYSPCPPIWLDDSIKEEYSPCPPIWLDQNVL